MILMCFFGIDSESFKKNTVIIIWKKTFTIGSRHFKGLLLGEIIASDVYNEPNRNESQNLIAVDLPDDLSLESARFIMIVRSN